MTPHLRASLRKGWFWLAAVVEHAQASQGRRRGGPDERPRILPVHQRRIRIPAAHEHTTNASTEHTCPTWRP